MVQSRLSVTSTLINRLTFSSSGSVRTVLLADVKINKVLNHTLPPHPHVLYKVVMLISFDNMFCV